MNNYFKKFKFVKEELKILKYLSIFLEEEN